MLFKILRTIYLIGALILCLLMTYLKQTNAGTVPVLLAMGGMFLFLAWFVIAFWLERAWNNAGAKIAKRHKLK